VTALQLYIDFKSPGSYLALKPTLALLEKTKATAQWLPFMTKQRPIPLEKENETRGETHSRVRENARRETHLLYAGLQSTAMHFPASPGNTDLALAALVYTQKVYTQNDPLRFVRAAYEAYWINGLDLADSQVINDLLQDNGYDAKAFDAEHHLQLLQESQTAAEASGVVEAPAYLIQDNLFIGREHLPWITELLTNG
jgi:2-hydroxychromene-2-carboxylate isomerase